VLSSASTNRGHDVAEAGHVPELDWGASRAAGNSFCTERLRPSDVPMISEATHASDADDAVDATAARTFQVRAENLPTLRARIERIDRRARRLGTGPVQLVDTGRRQRGRAVVILRGDTPRLEGWRIAAIVRHRGEDAQLRPVPGAPSLRFPAEGWRDARCDHCKVARNRKETFLLLHDGDGSVRQVGSSCLRDFLGGHDPERLCRQAEYLLLAGAELSDADRGTADRAVTLELEAFLAHAARVIRRAGWTPSAAATDRKPSSADQAEASLERGAPLEPADRRLARGTIAWARELLSLKPDPSSFELDLIAAVNEPWITRRERGLICAAVMIRRRELARARSRSRHRGRIGAEIELVGLVEYMFDRPSARWGSVHHAILRDLEGNRYRWWSSRPLPIEGHRAYRLAGRVTAHDEYRGERETVLTRCRTAPAAAG
jgi:hypothetical protein